MLLGRHRLGAPRTRSPCHRLGSADFLHRHRLFLAPKNIDIEKIVHTDCTKKRHRFFLHADTLPRTIFTQQKLFRTEAFTDRFFFKTHNNFYRQMVFTQKVLRTEVLRTEGFTHNIFYIQTLLDTDAFTRKTDCTRHVFTRKQFLHREVLFPLLHHLPFVFPLSSLYGNTVLDDPAATLSAYNLETGCSLTPDDGGGESWPQHPPCHHKRSPG